MTQFKVNIYLEYMQKSSTFAAENRKKLMNQMMNYTFYASYRSVCQQNGTDSQQTVHVHWFSGFI